MASFEAKRAFSTLVLQCQIYRFTAIPGEKKSVWGVPERDTRDCRSSGGAGNPQQRRQHHESQVHMDEFFVPSSFAFADRRHRPALDQPASSPLRKMDLEVSPSCP